MRTFGGAIGGAGMRCGGPSEGIGFSVMTILWLADGGLSRAPPRGTGKLISTSSCLVLKSGRVWVNLHSHIQLGRLTHLGKEAIGDWETLQEDLHMDLLVADTLDVDHRRTVAGPYQVDLGRSRSTTTRHQSDCTRLSASPYEGNLAHARSPPPPRKAPCSGPRTAGRSSPRSIICRTTTRSISFCRRPSICARPRAATTCRRWCGSPMTRNAFMNGPLHRDEPAVPSSPGRRMPKTSTISASPSGSPSSTNATSWS